jgi:hypothetical protein
VRFCNIIYFNVHLILNNNTKQSVELKGMLKNGYIPITQQQLYCKNGKSKPITHMFRDVNDYVVVNLS